MIVSSQFVKKGTSRSFLVALLLLINFNLFSYPFAFAQTKDYEGLGQPNDPVYLTKLIRVFSGPTHNLYHGRLALVPNPEKSDFTVPFFYYESRFDGPRPLVITPPNLNGVSVMEKAAAIYFATKGLSSLVFNPEIPIKEMNRTTSQVGAVFSLAVFSLKMMVDWACSHPDKFDTQKIGAFGMSLGGILSSILIGQDSRIKAAFLVVAGGDLPNILRKAKNPFLNRFRWSRIRNEGLKDTQGYEEALRRSINIDPLRPALHRNPDEIFMVLGQNDRVVPYANQKLLWEFFGKPKFDITPLGHTGGVMKVPFHLDHIINFFWTNWHKAATAANH